MTTRSYKRQFLFEKAHKLTYVDDHFPIFFHCQISPKPLSDKQEVDHGLNEL